MARNVLSPLAAATSTDLADWFELVTLVSRRRMLSPAKAKDLLGVFGGGADDTDIAFAFGELHARSERRLQRYPFTFTRLGIELSSPDAMPYALLLLTAAASRDFVELADGAEASIALERFVADALHGLLGPFSRTVRFGYPPESGRPASFVEAVIWLAGQLGARRLPLMGADLRRADGGVDVVGWAEHGDSFGPGPVLAAQVTYDSDLRGKSLEIAGSDFHRWYRLPPPVPVLASPVDGNADPDLMIELAGRVLFLDRWRLLASFERSGKGLPESSTEWISSVLKDMEI